MNCRTDQHEDCQGSTWCNCQHRMRQAMPRDEEPDGMRAIYRDDDKQPTERNPDDDEPH